MKRTIICITLLLCTFVGFGQQLVIPGYTNNGYTGHQLGDEFTTTIVNTGNQQVCLFVRLDGFGPGTEYIFWSDSARDSWIMSQIDEFAPIEQQVIQAIHAIEKIMKSDHSQNRHHVFDGWGSILQSAKKYSWVGFGHSHYNYQCGDFSYMLLRILESLGLSTWDELRLHNIGVVIDGEYKGLHTVGEVFSEGAWIKVDPDPGTPRTQELNPASPNGFASVQDILNDTSLVGDAPYHWISEFGDSVRLTNQTVSQYRQMFEETHPYDFFDEDLETYQLSPVIKIPSGVSMTTHKKEECILVDMSAYSTIQIDSIVGQYIAMYQSGDIEGIVSLVVSNTGLPETVVQEAVLDERVALAPVPYWPGYDRGSTLPYITFHVPSSPDTIFIGRDISAPLLVRKVDLPQGGAIYLDDEFIVNEREYFLFDTSNATGGMAPIVEDNDVHYFDRGFILPNTEALITCYVNPKTYNFWGGITFDVLCGELPVVEQEFSHGPYYLVTEVSNDEWSGFDIFPNPTTGTVTVKTQDGGYLSITDISGETLFTQKIHNHETSIHLELSSGMYLVSLAHHSGAVSTKKLVVQ